ncbi:hypothetical protein DCS_01896 [Drechmeria coniospora]|uniref:Uncharacterized protein n=1 Tax=Drechmeria coniospora TaxID=98403 RepID=A0A151GUK4_DRECN|nr:hypothetical protein DCS_01896 [Drechmeria coniospora]KYK60758.1 hypothetical protein DCS_01896 [Drechmeria coniospora]
MLPPPLASLSLVVDRPPAGRNLLARASRATLQFPTANLLCQAKSAAWEGSPANGQAGETRQTTLSAPQRPCPPTIGPDARLCRRTHPPQQQHLHPHPRHHHRQQRRRHQRHIVIPVKHAPDAGPDSVAPSRSAPPPPPISADLTISSSDLIPDPSSSVGRLTHPRLSSSNERSDAPCLTRSMPAAAIASSVAPAPLVA